MLEYPRFFHASFRDLGPRRIGRIFAEFLLGELEGYPADSGFSRALI